MRRKLTLILLAALLPLLVFPALGAPGDGDTAETSAADVNYSGPLDPMTGLPAGTRLSGDEPGYVTLQKDACSYDSARGCYVNTVGTLSFTSSVPNGAILNAGAQTVSFSIPRGLSAVLYRSGSAVADADLSDITDAGNYRLEVRAGNSTESVTFSFRLLGELSSGVSELALPAGFSFVYLRLDGQELTPEYSNYTTLRLDGTYEFCWACEEIGRQYAVRFTLDTAAPTLLLPEVVNGEAHSAVTLTDLEKDAYVLLTDTKTGETNTILYGDTQITQAGSYRLSVYDRAGNHTDYSFTIHVYLNISALAAIALVLAGIAALLGYSRYIRRHPRVG